MDFAVIAYLLASVLTAGLFLLAFHLWRNGLLGCMELTIAGVLMVIFLALTAVPHMLPVALALYLIPLVYIFARMLSRRAEKHLLRQLRNQDYDACNRVLAQDPRNVAAYARLGQMLEEDGLQLDALEAYESALRLNPEEPGINYRYAQLLEQVALAESEQVRCPECRAVQPKGAGICWRCGYVLDWRRAARARLAQLDRGGKIGALVFLGACSLCLVTLVSMTLVQSAAQTSLLALGLMALAASGLKLARDFREVARRDAEARAEAVEQQGPEP